MRGRKKKNLMIIILCVVLVFMGVGYAILTQTLTVKVNSKISGKWKVYIESITPTKVNGKAINRATVISTDKKGATFTADLYDEGDYIEYTIVVKNGGSISAKLNNVKTDITNSSSFVKFTTTAEKNYELAPNSTMTFTAKVYVENTMGTALTDAEGIKFILDLDFIQSDGVNADEENIVSDYAVVTSNIGLSQDDSVSYTYYSDGKLIISGSSKTRDFLLMDDDTATINNVVLVYSLPLKYIVKNHQGMTESDLYCAGEVISGICPVYDVVAQRMMGLISNQEFNDSWNSGDYSTKGKEWLLDVMNSFNKIKYIEIRDGITTIGTNMLNGISSEQTSFSIPDTVSTIKKGAFSNTNFQNINFPINTLFTLIPEEFCMNCSELYSLVIPASVTTIGKSAFENHKILTSIDLGTGVTNIENSAFYSINGTLTKITIPSNIISIGNNAFSGLNKVILTGNNTTRFDANWESLFGTATKEVK